MPVLGDFTEDLQHRSEVSPPAVLQERGKGCCAREKGQNGVALNAQRSLLEPVPTATCSRRALFGLNSLQYTRNTSMPEPLALPTNLRCAHALCRIAGFVQSPGFILVGAARRIRACIAGALLQPTSIFGRQAFHQSWLLVASLFLVVRPGVASLFLVAMPGALVPSSTALASRSCFWTQNLFSQELHPGAF